MDDVEKVRRALNDWCEPSSIKCTECNTHPCKVLEGHRALSRIEARMAEAESRLNEGARSRLRRLVLERYARLKAEARVEQLEAKLKAKGKKGRAAR